MALQLQGESLLVGMTVLLLFLPSSAPLSIQAEPTGKGPRALSALTSPPSSDCKRKCGNVSIPYPFGFGDEKCHASVFDDFNITCNDTFDPPKPFFGGYEIMEILPNKGQLRVRSWIAYDCYNKSGYNWWNQVWSTLARFTFSHTQNKFVALGCDTQAFIHGDIKGNKFTAGCISYIGEEITLGALDQGNCSGVGCCTTAVPRGLGRFSIKISSSTKHANCLDFNPCSYAFLVEEDQYIFNVSDLKYYNTSYKPPVIIDWFIGNQTCNDELESSKDYACVSENSECFNSSNAVGYNCKCKTGYRGNPYLRDKDSCQDIDECRVNPQICPENRTCANTEGNYNCTCPLGTVPVGDTRTNQGTCKPIDDNGILPLTLKLALGVGVALLLLLAAISCLCWGFQRVKFMEQTRKVAELKERLFEQNGGLFLRELIPPSHAFRIFTVEELMIATNDFDESQIAGRGGHGIVYKGRLADDTKIAIKKSKMVDERQSKEFAREIGILSQINHVNVVRLLGCCLEVEIPMLVYEYVERGTLYDFIHHPNHKNNPISLFTRMKIATEAAEALAYLHSYASRPILHGDVKTSNILLDEHYRAKISDFGGSTLMAPADEVQLATVVQGTCGYLDPEFLQTYQLTTKSDVYSFGVVLAEILTGKQPFRLHKPEDERSLSVTFVSALKEKKLLQILDAQVAGHDDPDQLWEIAQLVSRCLSAKGEDRPTMKEVTKILQAFTERADNKEHYLCWNRGQPMSEVEAEAETRSLLTAGVELLTYESSFTGVDTSSSYMISLQDRADMEAGR